MTEKRLSLGINVSILLILAIFGVLLSLPLRLLFDTNYSEQNHGDESGVSDPGEKGKESAIPIDHRKLKRCPNLQYEDRLMSVFMSDYDGNCTYVQDDESDDDEDDDDDDSDSEEEEDSREDEDDEEEETYRSKKSIEEMKESAEEILKSRQMKSVTVAGHILVTMLLVSVIAALVEVLRIRFAREKSDKREIPTTLRKALAVDAYLTNEFVKLVEKILPLRQLKVHNKLLEISCHGIPWLAVSLISIWVFNAKSLYQMQMNLLIGLLLDIIMVAILKAITRRRRPTTNDDPFSLGPDKYSFPSGHSSRSAFVVYFFFNLWPLSLIYSPPLLAWSFSVCMSRLLMRRHYILDVFGGVLLGIFEGLLIGYIYLEQETCIYLISWITDDKIPGSE
ncbi:PLPP6 phosphatase, partial [Acromyrmex charruanus]